eukprot:Ihof_evm1s1177 gene=Ihof_evmTU1s1177
MGSDLPPALALKLAKRGILKEKDTVVGAKSQTAKTAKVAVQAAVKGTEEKPLPSGWQKVLDEKTGHPYYWNYITNEVKWTIPDPEEKTEMPPIPPPTEPTAPAAYTQVAVSSLPVQPPYLLMPPAPMMPNTHMPLINLAPPVLPTIPEHSVPPRVNDMPSATDSVNFIHPSRMRVLRDTQPDEHERQEYGQRRYSRDYVERDERDEGKGRGRGRPDDRERDRYRYGDRDRDRERDRDRDRDRDSRDRDVDRDRDIDRDIGYRARGRSQEQEHVGSKVSTDPELDEFGRVRPVGRERSRSPSRERDRGSSIEQDRNRGREDTDNTPADITRSNDIGEDVGFIHPSRLRNMKNALDEPHRPPPPRSQQQHSTNQGPSFEPYPSSVPNQQPPLPPFTQSHSVINTTAPPPIPPPGLPPPPFLPGMPSQSAPPMPPPPSSTSSFPQPPYPFPPFPGQSTAALLPAPPRSAPTAADYYNQYPQQYSVQPPPPTTPPAYNMPMYPYPPPFEPTRTLPPPSGAMYGGQQYATIDPVKHKSCWKCGSTKDISTEGVCRQCDPWGYRAPVMFKQPKNNQPSKMKQSNVIGPTRPGGDSRGDSRGHDHGQAQRYSHHRPTPYVRFERKPPPPQHGNSMDDNDPMDPSSYSD